MPLLYSTHWILLLFVLPNLLHLNNRIEEFKKRGAEVIAISIDSQFTHQAWRNTPIEKGGIGQSNTL